MAAFAAGEQRWIEGLGNLRNTIRQHAARARSSDLLDEIVFGTGARMVRFGSPRVDDLDDPYGSGGFPVEIRADRLVASTDVFMLTFSWGELLTWFQDLADAWRGFDGPWVWRSIEGHLAITAVADPGGHVALEFQLCDGPYSSWEVRLDGVSVDAGEDLAALAARVRAWSPLTR